MKQTLLMERVKDQTRLAVIEDGALCELYEERPSTENLTGNIYLGRISNVLPGMNAAFVDIGLDKNGFLSASDVLPAAQGDSALSQSLVAMRIEKLVRPGQLLLVQVIRSQPGLKGPRLSCHITLPGRAMVLLAGIPHVGVSKKIEDEAERNRLRRLGMSLIDECGNGLIVRTAAKAASEESLRSEFQRLSALHASLVKRGKYAASPGCVYDDNELALRGVRDRLTDDVEAFWVDDEACHRRVLEYAEILAPELADRVILHRGPTPLFDLYKVDSQVDKALQRYVWLKGGGSLVIEETEALTVVDVNTGKNIGKHDADDTILATNCEAAHELLRQLRLRDIGGMIVVDFIDMRRESDRQALLSVLREGAAHDRNPVTVVDITPLGLVEMTRKRARQSLARQMTHVCAHCDGNGTVLSHEATARRALRALWRRRRGGDETPLQLEAEPAVCIWVKKIGLSKRDALKLVPDDSIAGGEYRFSPLQSDD